MRKFALLLLAIGGLLSACVAYEVQPGGSAYRDLDRDGVPIAAIAIADGDGVSNRNDSRPDDPRRY